MAVFSKVQICNMALSHLGTRSKIESLTETSGEADACNRWYDQARIETLESYDWNFARKRSALTPHSEDPPDGIWAYRYQYPVDCLRARELENPSSFNQSIFTGIPVELIQPDSVPFTVEMADDDSKSILTDLDDAVLIYTFDQDNVDLFTASFRNALTFSLAAYIAYSLTGKQALSDRMFQEWQRRLNYAAVRNANERVNRAPRDSEFIRARM